MEHRKKLQTVQRFRQCLALETNCIYKNITWENVNHIFPHYLPMPNEMPIQFHGDQCILGGIVNLSWRHSGSFPVRAADTPVLVHCDVQMLQRHFRKTFGFMTKMPCHMPEVQRTGNAYAIVTCQIVGIVQRYDAHLQDVVVFQEFLDGLQCIYRKKIL